MARKRGRRKKPFKVKLKKEILYSIVTVIFSLLALIILLSLTRQGLFLSAVYVTLFNLFGWTLLILPFLFISLALMMTQLKWPITNPNVFVGGLLMFLGAMSITRAGQLGDQIFGSIEILITGFGAGAAFFALFIIGLMVLTNTPLDEFLIFIHDMFSKLLESLGKVKSTTNSDKVKLNKLDTIQQTKINIPGMDSQLEKKSEKPTPKKEEKDFESEITSVSPQGTQIWKYPPLSILSSDKGAKADRGDLKENANIIESTLDSFGIQAKVAEVNGGPAVTQYAIRIAEGTKLSKIKSLQNDLALALAAPTGQIRIEAPIPGRSLVGIEIPNRSAEFVTLKEILTSKEMKSNKSKLAIGLGLGVSGDPAIADIKKMPHVLIAGATGSGKSVCVNTIITTILFRNSPDEVKFILIDPKRVELTGYNGIPHLLTPVINEPERVIAALQWAAKKMDERYKLFQEVGARNIEEYNELSGFTAMEYIVIVIDELADIMLFAPSKVEDLITRLAQMARATGIHLVLATQRPSVNVITGLIKANIPARIAFNVTSMVDSRVIIDTPGAEKLLGKGDMLFVPPDQALPKRIQGTFVNNQEIRDLIEHLKKQAEGDVEYEEEVTEKYLSEGPGAGGLDDIDELFDEAILACIEAGKGSTSYLQRKLSVGYNRAARIMDQLEVAGVVGPQDGPKAREVLVSSLEEWKSRTAEQE